MTDTNCDVRARIPIFPLGAVLFPGGILPLQIFEPRYLDMVSERLKRDAPFGVCLIRDGREVGAAADAFDTGTLAHIGDWQRLPNGLLGLSTRGGRRFRIRSREVRKDQLLVAEVEPRPEPPRQAVPPAHAGLLALLSGLRRRLGLPFPDPAEPEQAGDAGWVAYRLAEILPLSMGLRQTLLEIDDPLARLDRLAVGVAELAHRDEA